MTCFKIKYKCLIRLKNREDIYGMDYKNLTG